MSEELEGAESAAQGIDPVAAALALDSADRAEANAFLRDQRKLIALQAKELAHELDLRHWTMLVRHVSAVLKLTLELGLGFLALALVAGVGLMVWNAARSDGLVLESFKVPPDLVEKGDTGDVLATRLLDKLNLIQDANGVQTRPGRSLSGSFGEDIKVEIPETGVSLGELYRFLRRWLGHESHIGGDVVRTPDGITVSVRIDGRNGASFAGTQSDLDSLMLKAAEHVVDVTDPARYGVYLASLVPPRVAESVAVLERGAGDPTLPVLMRATAFNDLGIDHRRFMADERGAASLYRQAIALMPDYPIARANLAVQEQRLGHDEAAAAMLPAALVAFGRHASEFYPDTDVYLPARLRAEQAELLGDMVEAERQTRTALAVERLANRDSDRRAITFELARRHDGGAMRAWLAQMPPPAQPTDRIQRLLSPLRTEAALEHWPQVIAAAPAAAKAATDTSQFHFDTALITAIEIRPWVALAKARTGDGTGAESLIAATPGDCYDCVRVRGMVASQAEAWGRADYWFAKAVHDAPSIPFAYESWGRSLLARGKPDDAIAQFNLSKAKGPHFADPLEGWGEALMAKNQSHLALAKFTEANKYAPNWGRLHLKWGEALLYAGKPGQARAQFTRAATLDLTPAEKSELARSGHV